jgi:hypothetical protein
MLMYVHHDALSRFVVFIEETLEHVDNELHRRVVVVEQENAVQVWPLGLRPRLGDDRRTRTILIMIPFALAVIVCHARWKSRGIFIRRHFRVYCPNLLVFGLRNRTAAAACIADTLS